MENENVGTEGTASEVNSPSEFIKQLGGMLKGLQGGREIATAARIEVNENRPIVTKDSQATTFNQQVNTSEYVDPYAKCFETLAKSYPGFRILGTAKALNDPVGYLREKDEQGRWKVSNAMLDQMIAGVVHSKHSRGTHVDEWAAKGGGIAVKDALYNGANNFAGSENNDVIVKAALDTTTGGGTSGGVLIRTDIDPLLREAYLRRFPFADRMRYIPSNGLVHTYNVRTATGAATTLSELGDLSGTDTNSTYAQRHNSNIAVIANRRGVGLKLQYAVAQSGMSSFDLSGRNNLEVGAAITAIARKNQTLMFQGNFSHSGGAPDQTTEFGLYDANGYDGYRILLMGAASSTNKATGDLYMDALNNAVGTIIDAGGSVDDLIIPLTISARKSINKEFQPFLRVLAGGANGAFDSNLSAGGILTISDFPSKFMNVPQSATQPDGIGHYIYSAVDTQDMYVIDPSGSAMAYLGSPTPVVMELPVGFNNQLSNVYVCFLMNGLVVDLPEFNQKVRVPA